MTVRNVLFALGAVLLCAATKPPPPPPVLQPYIKNGRFDPGDYGWMKGRFDDATPEEKARFQSIRDWFGRCFDAAGAELRQRLREEGYADVNVESLALAPTQCAGYGEPMLPDTTSFATFQRELAVASPLADGFLTATAFAGESANLRRETSR